jgi:hypothetical protein
VKYLESIEDADDIVLACRMMGHAWDLVNEMPEWSPSGRIFLGVHRIEKCMRCSSGRTRRLNAQLEIIPGSTRIHHRDAYVMAKGRRAPRSAASFEHYRRVQLIP